VDVLALPATPTVPPPRESTGSSAFLSPFSLLGSPAIAIPCGVTGGLPQSLQLAGLPGDDDRLLAVARWCEEVLGPSPVPPTLSSPARDGSNGA
jgi:Asp-tRNA(Asn)/Glu-tRNA(Gln) amidotransferase A subunit family amidase